MSSTTVMRIAMGAVLLLPVTGWAQAAKTANKRMPAKETGKLEIPAAAVASDDGSYHFTDTQGKKWIYRKTPFGVARVEDKPEPKPAPEATAETIKVTEDGDSLKFERPGPFGLYKWQRKKTELNELEKAAWDREKARAAAKQE